jgi:WD40 repeat protein
VWLFQQLILGFADGAIRRYDLAFIPMIGQGAGSPMSDKSGELLLPAGGPVVSSLAVSQNGTLLSAGFKNGDAKCWSVVGNRSQALDMIIELNSEAEAIVDVSEAGFVVGSSRFPTVRYFDFNSGEYSLSEKLPGAVFRFGLIDDLGWVAVGGFFEGLKILELPKLRVLGTFGNSLVDCMHIDPTGKSIVVGHNDGMLRTYDPATGEILGAMQVHAARIMGYAQTRDAKFGVSVDVEGKVVVSKPSSSLVLGRLFDGESQDIPDNNYSHYISCLLSPEEDQVLVLVCFAADDQVNSWLRLYPLSNQGLSE